MGFMKKRILSAAPEAIFDAFLRNVEGAGFSATPRVLHSVFYRTALKHPTEMSGFDFLLRTEPYSPTLARLVWEFQQAGRLGRLNPDFNGYILKSEGPPLADPDDESIQMVVGSLVSCLADALAREKERMSAVS